jgi:hypothetical protein
MGDKLFVLIAVLGVAWLGFLAWAIYEVVERT